MRVRYKTQHAAAAPLRLRRTGAAGAGAADVYERIWTAIVDHSLPPETRLVEERLCEIFGIGRTRVRQGLQRLGPQRGVTPMPNPRAMGSQPEGREARE